MSVLSLYVLVVLPTLLVAATGGTLIVLWKRLHVQRRSNDGSDPAINERKSATVLRLVRRSPAS